MAALDGRFHCAYCVLAVPYPNFPDKHLATPLVTPQRFLEYARASGRLEGFEPPKGVLLIYKRSLMASLVESHAAQEETRIPQLTSAYRLPRTGGAVGLLGDFGIGGPVVSILVEEHAALDVTYFFSLGLAGGLQSDGRIGDIVLCTRAIRDEGVSHHYLAADVEAKGSFHGLGIEVTGHLTGDVRDGRHEGGRHRSASGSGLRRLRRPGLQRSPALHAELRPGRRLSATGGTTALESRPALHAELGPSRVLRTAVPAGHTRIVPRSKVQGPRTNA